MHTFSGSRSQGGKIPSWDTPCALCVCVCACVRVRSALLSVLHTHRKATSLPVYIACTLHTYSKHNIVCLLHWKPCCFTIVSAGVPV